MQSFNLEFNIRATACSHALLGYKEKVDVLEGCGNGCLFVKIFETHE